MTDRHVEEEKPGPNFKKTIPVVDPDVLSLMPFEAYEWLLAQFKRYMHNEINWTDVRNLFATADAWKSIHAVPKHPQSAWERIEAQTKMKAEILNQ
jgi:hypothetical protein